MRAQVNVQLAPGADVERATTTIAGIEGVLRVRQVFPDQADAELQRMFVLDVDGDQKETALAALRHASIVEDAELAPQRSVAPPSTRRGR